MTLRRYTTLKSKTALASSTKPMPRVSPGKRHWKSEALICQLEYRETHLRCALCGISAMRWLYPDRLLQLHHLAGKGSATFEVHGNYLMLCGRDHAHYHDGGQMSDSGERLPELTPGMILWCKREADGLDVALLASLKGWQALPDKWEPCELPAEFLRERELNMAA